MTIRKERRRLEKRLKRTQYTQKSITMATTLVAGSTFIPTLGHAAETATTETSNDLKVVEQTTNTTPETDSTPVEETTASTTAPVVTEETSETTEESGTKAVTEGSETATTESTTVASDEVLEADEVPSALSDLTSRALFSRATIDPAAFISQICGYATEVAAANDLYASVMMAQAILESGWGASTLTTTANNMFGIKGSYNGQYVTMDTYEDDGSGNYYLISAKFRKYPSLKESFEDNAYVLRNTSFSSGNYYYSGAWKSNTTSYTQATAWLQGRYATDTSYASKLNNLISTYNLTQYDTGSSNAGGNSNETIVSDETAINQQMKTTSSMNIRSDASTSASITGSLAANTTFTATATKTGTSVNGNTTWYKISGKGWVSGAYLTKVSTDSSNNNSGSGNTGSDNSNSGTTINKQMKTTEAMNIRSSASTSGSVVGSLSKGTTFTATSMKTGTSVNGNKNWYYVSGKGWVSGAYLTEVTNNNASEAEKEDNSSSLNQKMKTTAALNVRSDASTSSRVVTTLGQGVTVTVTAKKNGTSVDGNKTWYYVSGKGWVSGAYLTTTSSSSNNSGSTTTNQQMKTTEILNVRSDASTSSSITGSLSKGATVTVTATKTGTTVNGTNKWYYVSGKGWVSGAYLTAASSGSSNTNTSSSSSTKTHTVKSGDSLWSLAQKYNTSISQIASWNKINSSYTIYVGQKLIVSK